MVKYLLIFAFTANAIFLVSSTGKEVKKVQKVSSRSSSSSSSSSHSSSESFSISDSSISPVGPCSHGHEYQHATRSSVSSSSSSHSSSSSSTSSIDSIASSIHHPDCRTCRTHERWVQCPDTVCVPKTCDDVGYPVPCVDLNPDGKCPSKPACICEENYVRNRKGLCIPMKNCTSCGGDPNAESGCGTNCNRLCSNYYKKNVACILSCLYNGCDCKPGYVYDEILKKCVLPSQCTPPVKCKKNEIYDLCPAPCPPRRCDVNEALILCAVPPQLGDPECEPGCRCIDGYVKNNNDVCIPKDQCPKCPPNEVFDPCIAPCPPRRCDVDERLIKCAAPPKPGSPLCEAGCRCADGYKRNYDGVCIPADQCPTCTQPNEVYDPCPKSCPPQTCESINKTYHCPIQDQSCKPGKCVCKKGYYRNKIGECISKEDCQKCTGPHEYFSCGSACDNVCGLLATQNKTNCPIVNIVCNPQCYCEDGYARDDNHICIPIKDCKDPQCGPDERYEICPSLMCQPFTCDQVGFPVYCPDWTGPGCPGKSACVCRDNYVRDKRGRCIPRDECPSCGGDTNQVSGCGVYCNQRCRNIGKEPEACILLCYPNGCDCRKDYYLDENTGKCVLPKNCTPQCPYNEVYSTCIQGNCGPKNCTDLGFPQPCPRINPKYCKKGCICKEGYVRDNYGMCIPSTECPKCPPNEVFDPCIAPCPPRRCDVDERLIKCAAPPKPGSPLCEAGCRCADGYKRNYDGVCIPADQCPTCTQPNEVYDPCPKSCPPQTCESINKTYHCPIQDQSCKPGKCVCKKGYYRNKIGECISKEDCQKCTGPHEYFSCGSACDNVCGLLATQNKTNCPIVNIVCNPQCYCEDGYARDDNHICIPIKDCKDPQCGPDERYEICPSLMCQPFTCDQVGFPVYCPDWTGPGCPGKSACVCRDNYVRDKRGRCIPRDECPSCGGDTNQVSGCGVYCNQRCRNIGKEPEACILLCYPNGCDCRKDYYLDENTGKCVLPKNCTPQCPYNEVYSTCIQGNCGPKNCTDLGFPQPCPRINPKYCKKGCICKEGYVRDNYGMCIPSTECPSCGGDPNAQAGCGTNCNKHCSDIGQEPKFCILSCELNGCDCKDGYYKDSNTNKCVKPEECSPQCPVNERYSDCVQGDCTPQNCTQLGFPIPCPRIDPAYCKKGCLCNEGYVRNANRVCIPSNECPACKGDPNKVSGCGVYCNQRCRDIGKEPGGCILVCYENACDCREGYYLDDNTGDCVLPEQCTPQCPYNEVYSDCIQGNCGPKNCTDLGFPQFCPRVIPEYCKKGCICKEGYVRDINGICIPSKDCPSCGGDPNAQSGCGGNCNRHCSDIGKEPGPCILICEINGCDCKDGYYYDDVTKRCVKPKDCSKGPVCLESNNEVYSDCINGGCQAKNCSQYNKPVPCVKINPKYCIKGCLCKDGYLRAPNGQCIPERDCEEACTGPNEEYNECAWDCPPQTCESLDKAYSCPLQNDDNCKPMCRCKSGYFRNLYGECITEEQCRRCNGPHEYYSCGVACDNVCATLDEQSQDNCPIINIKCNEMCYCEKDYARAKNNTCIPISSCNEPQCPINERYERCPGMSCEPQHCSQLGKPIPCPLQAEDRTCPTKPGCVCIDGYVRDKDGKCIPIKQCPSCGGDPNAESGCGINCGRLCTDIGKKGPFVCPAICKVNGCDCKPGFYYDSVTKKCVKPEQCTKVSCGGDPNAEPGCGVNCGRLCSDIGKKGPFVCPAICYENGCDCKPGFFYDTKTGKCVKPEQCTKVPIICLEKNNEVYSDCINGGCGWKNCSQYGKPVPCIKIDPKYCIKGCLCKEGYLRSSNGKCIPQKNCPEACNGPNEEYEECTFNCPPRTCESLDRAYVCPIREGDVCSPLCNCKPGYFRSKTGQCITEKQCRMCLGPHEHYACGGACDNVCATLKKQNQTNCPIINIKCNEMCYCDEGYARAANKTCIPIKYCNERQCPLNERYEKCPAALCEPQKCSQLGYPIECPALPPNGRCPSKPGCVCIDGYVRDKTGKCIPKQQCPSCGGDPNAISGCGVNCGKRCKDLGRDGVACIEICYVNACDCKDGYYYDDNQKKCVLPGQCTDICGKNEVFEDCSNPICRAENCTQLGFPLDCDTECKKGCYCKEGFARNYKGNCIPVKQCPSCGGDPHAESGCGINCLKKCYDLDNPDSPRPCPKICKVNSCDCKKDYYYDENLDKCVLADDCSPSCGGDEVYSPCVNGGCEMKNCSQLGGPQLCIDPIECIEGCICKEGYLRSDNGICVPINKCPAPKCPRKNERFSVCPAKECAPQSCNDIGFPIDCPGENDTCPGEPGCICINGYVRNNKGICRPKSECPNCGGDPNAKPGCGVNCGKRCPNNNLNPKLCPRICFPNACDCKDTYFYDGNTKSCVKYEDCSPLCGDNEVYTPCVNGGCEMKNCSQLGGPQLCIDPIKCIGGCICRENYLRIDNGTCVPIKKCPPPKCLGENEMFSICPAKECQPQSCNDIGIPIDCPGPNETCPGEPGCICNYGYVRNSQGICRPKNECTSCGGDPNAMSGCGINCDKRCPNNFLNTKLCPRICLPNACDCKKNYFYDVNVKQCVRYDECSPRCDELNYEVYDPCVNGGCGWRNCSQVGGPKPCIDPIKCEKGCRCKQDYYRLNNGTCVPERYRSTTAKSKPVTTQPPVNVTAALANFELANQKLAGEFVYQMFQKRPGQNFMVSGLSALLALAQILLFAVGTTLEQLLNLFNLNNKEEVRVMFPVLLKKYKEQTDVIFKSANKYYANVNFPLTDNFKQVTNDIFDAQGQNLDFSKTQESADIINQWVEEMTNHLIKNLISPRSLSADTRCVLVNALYFLGNWTRPFDKKNTEMKDFYVDENKTVSVNMMYQQGKFLYGESDVLDCKIAKLLYKGGDFSFVIFLPRSTTGLSYAIDKFKNPGVLYEAINSLLMKEVRVSCPVMDVETDISDLSDLLKLVGLTEPFKAGAHSFEGITVSGEELTISDAIQKTRVKVDEKGTEAAAATAIIVGVTSVQIPTEVYDFNCNHPFAFVLLSGDTPLFSGVYAGDK